MDIYQLKNKVRVVSAASLYDGHDATINIMRRIIQRTGAEVIHLGHNRSVREIVDCAIQEDAQAIAITSYQGGHNEFFRYMYDLLKEAHCEHIRIFGGGGGVILPDEIEELHKYGITRIYSPDDGRTMGLQGMINDLLEKSDFPTGLFDDESEIMKELETMNFRSLGRIISAAENHYDTYSSFFENLASSVKNIKVPILGITGTGGSGKSSLVDELVRRFLLDFEDKNIGIISVDPSKRKTGGALLGDRIRMNSINTPRVYMRSLATRQANLSLSKYMDHVINIYKKASFDMIILETSGIGQSDTEIVDFSDVSLYVMTPDYGAPTQLEKIDMLDFADLIALNKFDHRGAKDALRDVRKQYKRNHNLFDINEKDIPVFATVASQFNDEGVNHLYSRLMQIFREKKALSFPPGTLKLDFTQRESSYIIPPARNRYLAEIAENNRAYDAWVNKQAEIADRLSALKKTTDLLRSKDVQEKDLIAKLEDAYTECALDLDPKNKKLLEEWSEKVKALQDDFYVYQVRDKDVRVKTFSESLSHSRIPKISLPRYRSWGDLLKWLLQENVPGEFPYTAGVFPFKRTAEDPIRMFAGEGGPERTNKRFHYISLGMPVKRLSTAYDSITLYGENPDVRPDIYGKIGNSGVSIACLDDSKKLYSGFDLADPATSVSMTINGPAPMLVGFFFNTAIDQQCEKYILNNGLKEESEEKIEAWFRERNSERPRYNFAIPENNNGLGLMLLGLCGDDILPKEIYEKIKADTISKVRGTVQADILKEDQAQNTCIFSTEFSLRMMGDIQEYFIENKVRNFYSVSISGYHIAEAGANPITQLALTLSNGFTYVEYYKHRGMDINSYAPNLSFFFSNGVDPEYAVIGRVARRIWAKAMKLKYAANARSQMLKYHIQTSGRSLHAQEIDFNDIRTTLQALYAIYDNCNSLHTNAYDEAITTPTEESVRRAIAIQMIINKELGLAKNENPLQGAFIIDELTDLVEEAVLSEFERISERGGVLGAMETMYQRGKIQEESLQYETLKSTGEYPIIGVNTFLSSKGSPIIIPDEVIRSTEEEKQYQLKTIEQLHKRNEDKAKESLSKLKKAAISNQNTFEQMMEAAKYCSIGQITQALYDVGGQYRRNM